MQKTALTSLLRQSGGQDGVGGCRSTACQELMHGMVSGRPAPCTARFELNSNLFCYLMALQ